jgi:hypothetical protein
MKIQFNKKHLTLILSLLLPAANGNAAETAGVSVDSAVRTGPKAPTTRLVSVNLAGTASGNDKSVGFVLSADGRFVAFASLANDLVANDTNGALDAFVRNLKTGTTLLASVNCAGTASGNGGSYLGFVLSADGRFVAFTSEASDLVANDINGVSDTFVRDLKTGTTRLVSINRAGTSSGNSESFDPVLSAGGRIVAFSSEASDLVLANDTNNERDAFVRDLKTGTTTLISINRAGTASGNGGSYSPALSADGRLVAFGSFASDLVANDTNGAFDAFVRDLKTGTTTLVGVNSAGTASGNHFSSNPVLSADGRFVAFYSEASDLVVNDANGTLGDAFVRDLKIGTTTLVSVNSAGTASGNGVSFASALSTDGWFVGFSSKASDLVANDTNGESDTYVRDLKTGTTKLVSINSAGTASGNGFSFEPVLSADGRFVAFASFASDLVANDTNGALLDAFVRDLKTGTTTLASVNLAGTASGNGDIFNFPALSANGRFVAFDSLASDLVANDTNGAADVFVRPTQDRKREDQGESHDDVMQGNGKSQGRFAFR